MFRKYVQKNYHIIDPEKATPKKRHISQEGRQQIINELSLL